MVMLGELNPETLRGALARVRGLSALPPLAIPHPPEGILDGDDEAARLGCCADVFARQAELVAGAAKTGEGSSSAAGRVLISYPRSTMSDGLAADASGGYFDICNVPPPVRWMMLWVHGDRLDDTKLLAWIPGREVATVDGAVSVNAEGCIEWLDGPLQMTVQHEAILRCLAGG